MLPQRLDPAALPALPPGGGPRIEAAWRLADGRLLVMTSFDIPYEEQLVILLLDRAGGMLERRTLGGAFTQGWLAEARADGPDSVTFRFPDARAWRVSVGATPPSWRRLMGARALRLAALER